VPGEHLEHRRSVSRLHPPASVVGLRSELAAHRSASTLREPVQRAAEQRKALTHGRCITPMRINCALTAQSTGLNSYEPGIASAAMSIDSYIARCVR